jgi:hypothetical protein
MMKKKYNTMPRKKTKPKNLSTHAKYNTPWISLPLYQSTAEGGGDKRAEQRSLLLCQTDPSPHVHRCNTCMREERPLVNTLMLSWEQESGLHPPASLAIWKHIAASLLLR